jgi:hypothetical protein
VKFSFVGATDTIDLRMDAQDYLRAKGGSGWGMAPVANFWFEGVGDGAQYRGTRRTKRTYVMPVAVLAPDPRDLEDRIRRMSQLIRDPFVIQAEYSDGRIFTIPAVYDSGAEGSEDSGWSHAQFPLTFQCGDPYWTSEQVWSLNWSDASQVAFLATLTLSASTLSGTREVNNRGDVEVRPSWVIQAPFDSVAVSVGGVGFSFTQTLASGFLSIKWEKDGWKVTDQAGVNRYNGFASTPRFPLFPRGLSQVDVTITGVGAGTRVSVFWPERREVVY